MAMYELWEMRSGNLVRSWGAEAEALAVIRNTLGRHGTESLLNLSLLVEDSDGETTIVAEGQHSYSGHNRWRELLNSVPPEVKAKTGRSVQTGRRTDGQSSLVAVGVGVGPARRFASSSLAPIADELAVREEPATAALAAAGPLRAAAPRRPAASPPPSIEIRPFAASSRAAAGAAASRARPSQVSST